MHKVLDRAVFLGLLASNPLGKVQIPQKKSEHRGTIKQVTADQVLELHEVLHVINVATGLGGIPAACVPVWALSGLGGARPGEGLAALWPNITLPEVDELEYDEEGNVLGRAFGSCLLTGTRTSYGEFADAGDLHPDEGPLKHRSDDASRLIELSPELCDVLRAHRSQFEVAGCDHVAVTVDGVVITHSQYQQAWERVRKVALRASTAA